LASGEKIWEKEFLLLLFYNLVLQLVAVKFKFPFYPIPDNEPVLFCMSIFACYQNPVIFARRQKYKVTSLRLLLTTVSETGKHKQLASFSLSGNALLYFFFLT